MLSLTRIDQIYGGAGILGLVLLLASNPGITQSSARSGQPEVWANHWTNQAFPSDCWEIHSLGTLGGPFSEAVDLNGAGQVTGNAATEPRELDPADPPWTLIRPFISAPNGGAITEIITPGYLFGTATAINEAGQIFGDTTIGRSFPVSYVTDPGGGNVRTTLAWTYVRDANDVGQTLWDIWYPFFTPAFGPNEQPDQRGTDLIYVDVPSADPYTSFITAVAMNDAGQVAVNVLDSGAADMKAYRWSTYEGARPLAPNAIGARAIQMNESGEVVGIITTKAIANGQPGTYQAFVTQLGTLVPIMLGVPGDNNAPTDINYTRQIVGTTTVNGQTLGYVTAPHDVQRVIHLDRLEEVVRNGWSNLRPAAINDRGQIAGTGALGGRDLAFLLSPQSSHAYLPSENGKQPQCYLIAAP